MAERSIRLPSLHTPKLVTRTQAVEEIQSTGPDRAERSVSRTDRSPWNLLFAGNRTGAERCSSDSRAKERNGCGLERCSPVRSECSWRSPSQPAAKVGIAEARISGPGLSEDGLRIFGAATEGMWESGLDWGGLDDTRAGSVVELGLTVAELGPRYVVAFRLDAGTKATEIVRQELYPYATGGPVTYTPPGQAVAEGLSWEEAISAGWYQTSPRFFDFLVDQGLPESNHVVVADREFAPDPRSAGRPLWGWVVAALVGLVALSIAATQLRRRSQPLQG
jgi:hypothetical protein